MIIQHLPSIRITNMSSIHSCTRCIRKSTDHRDVCPKVKRGCSLNSNKKVTFKKRPRTSAVNARYRNRGVTSFRDIPTRLPTSRTNSQRTDTVTTPTANVILPDELVLKIFSKLRFHTLIECKFVSTTFNAIASDVSLYTRLPYKVWNDSLSKLSLEKTVQILKSYPKLEAWTFASQHKPDPNGLEKLAHVIPNLKRIDVTEVKGYQSMDLLKYWPRLETIIAPEYFSIDLSNLKVLELVEGRQKLPAIESKSLERICAGQTRSVQQVLDGCPNLKHVRLHWQILEEELSSSTLQSLAVFCIESPNAVHGCTNLQELEITETNAPNMTSPTARTLRIWNGDVQCFLLDRLPSVRNLECNYSNSTLSEGFASTLLQRLELANELPNTYSLPNVSELVLQRVPISSGIRLAGLRTLSIRCFANKAALISTLLQCPLLTTIHLQCTVPWLDSGDIRAPSSENTWRELIDLGFKSVSVIVGDELRGTMPPSFDQLLSEHRAGFATPHETAMFT